MNNQTKNKRRYSCQTHDNTAKILSYAHSVCPKKLERLAAWRRPQNSVEPSRFSRSDEKPKLPSGPLGYSHMINGFGLDGFRLSQNPAVRL
jgi:uncharacterized Zn-finger protein